MNRLIETITKQSENFLNIYCTAGYPNLNDTVKILEALQNAGVNAIEIGIPFSDPLADGPTVQQSNAIALDNGISIPKIFEQLKDVRKTVTIPLILMGYLNPVLPKYKPIFEQNNLSNICLITPKTSIERIKEIDEQSSGFIYAVSSNSTTGTKDTGVSNTSFFEQLSQMDLNNPIMIGFNIKDNATFTKACKYANGALIGSAFVRAIEKSENLEGDIESFVNKVRRG